MKKNGKQTALIVAVAVLAVALIGVTYAWLTQTIDKTKTNVIKAGNLKLTYTNETDGIYLSGEKAAPMTDENGEKTTPYTFTLKNEGDFSAKYTMYLDNTDTYNDGEKDVKISSDEFMKDAFIKFQFISTGPYSGDSKPEGTSSTTNLQLLSTLGEHPSRVLEEGDLAAGQSKDYELRLWIADTADNTVAGTVFAGKIRIEATQSANTGE